MARVGFQWRGIARGWAAFDRREEGGAAADVGEFGVCHQARRVPSESCSLLGKSQRSCLEEKVQGGILPERCHEKAGMEVLKCVSQNV